MTKAQTEELQFHFCHAMANLSTRGKSGINTMWENALHLQQKNKYHNLDLVYQDLDVARNLDFGIPDHLIVMEVLRYQTFSTREKDNNKTFSGWVKHLLNDAFGWERKNIDQLMALISASSMMNTMSANAHYALRLAYDIKMSRFAKDSNSFAIDRENARREFANVSDTTFYQNEKALLLVYNNLEELFSLEKYRTLTAAARQNMNQRLIFVNDSLKSLIPYKNI